MVRSCVTHLVDAHTQMIDVGLLLRQSGDLTRESDASYVKLICVNASTEYVNPQRIGRQIGTSAEQFDATSESEEPMNPKNILAAAILGVLYAVEFIALLPLYAQFYLWCAWHFTIGMAIHNVRRQRVLYRQLRTYRQRGW